MDRSGSTAPSGLLPFFTERRSPMCFDRSHTMPRSQAEVLLEAARLAPSAGNAQPWAFIVGLRGDAVHDRMTRHLARSAAAWAPDASLLLANLAHRWVEDSTLEYSEFALYDLGHAVSHLTFQAHALGFAVHQFRAFDRDRLADEFHVPAHWEVTSMAAVGVARSDAHPQVGSTSDRTRMALDELVWPVDGGRS